MSPSPSTRDGVVAGVDMVDCRHHNNDYFPSSFHTDMLRDMDQSYDKNGIFVATPPPPPPRYASSEKTMCVPAPSFYCPLTMALMKDPVQDREGNSYEKGAIVKWLSQNNTSPVTRNILRKKHLVPNRALKDAIEFEETRQKEKLTRKTERTLSSTKILHRSKSATTLPSKSEMRSTKSHHPIINSVLSKLSVKSQLDNFGIAFLPMNKIQPTINNQPINMLMMVNAPQSKETFQLYTHFNVSIDKENCFAAPLEQQPGVGTSSNDNRVFNNLLQHGKHKALTLRKECEDRMRFGFEGKNSEIGSSSNFIQILNMFVKVSFRMKKRIRALEK